MLIRHYSDEGDMNWYELNGEGFRCARYGVTLHSEVVKAYGFETLPKDSWEARRVLEAVENYRAFGF